MSKLQLKIFLKKSYEFSLVLFQFFIIILHFIHLEFIPNKEIMQVNFFFSFVGFSLIIISTIVMLISIKDLGRNLSPFPRPIVNGNLITSGIYRFIRHPMYYSLILISFLKIFKAVLNGRSTYDPSSFLQLGVNSVKLAYNPA